MGSLATKDARPKSRASVEGDFREQRDSRRERAMMTI
jgi:hypothetical protein